MKSVGGQASSAHRISEAQSECHLNHLIPGYLVSPGCLKLLPFQNKGHCGDHCGVGWEPYSGFSL